MNKASKITAASSPLGGPGAVPQQCVAAPDTIPEAFSGDAPVSKTGEQGSIPCGGATRFIPCDPSEGYGTSRCTVCGRGFCGCICDVPEPEPEYFRSGTNFDPDNFVERIAPLPSGWARVEL